jgi:Carboxypeptidase regulatory-like domain
MYPQEGWVMRFDRFSFRTILFVLILGVFAGRAAAQSDRGTIAGTVLDSSGGTVVNATVTATLTETGGVNTATTGPTGGFRLYDLRVGTYKVTVTAQGFKTEEKTGVVVQINSTASLEFSLQLGDVKETVTIIADAPGLQTESSDIGTVVDKRQIQDLPLSLSASGQSFLRSPEAFVFLTPGTAGPGTNSDSPSSGTFEAKLSGGQNFSTEVILDGASIVHAELGSTFDENAPSVEALNEFKVLTSLLPAEFGRTTGGVESFTTKSGSNLWHGTAFDILHNDKLNANSWTNNLRGAPRPRDHQNDFGGNLGGPVWIPKIYNGRDKTFFFFNYEQYRNNIGTSSVTTLPTDAERSGDFSALIGGPTGAINPCDNTPVLKGQIFDPNTSSCPTGLVGGRIAFQNNQVPLSSTVAQNVLAFLTVHPNLPGDLNGLTNNFLFLSNKPIRTYTMSFRIDQNWGEKNKFWFSYNDRDLEALNGTPALPVPLDQTFFRSRVSHYLRFGWDRAISSSLLNHFNVGFNRLNDPSKGTAVTGEDWPEVLGISGAHGPGFPQFGFGGSPLGIGYASFGGGSFDNAIPNSLIVADSVSWIKGRHSFRFGFEWRYSQFSRIANSNTSPIYDFENFQTAFAKSDSQTGDPFASFLLGLPNEEKLTVSSHNPRWIQNYYAGYVQDDFKFRKNLTLNLGLRYEVETPRHEAEGAQSVLDLAASNNGSTDVPISPAVPGALIYGSNARGAKTYYKGLGPRIGFAYAPEKLFGFFPQTVFRGGYGIYYSALSYSDFGDSLTSGTSVTPDFVSQDSFTPVQSLDAGFPSFPPPSNANDPALLNGGFAGTPNYVAAEYGRPSMVQNWSLEVQHQLATDLILSVGYVGTRATRLRSNLVQINTLEPQFYPLGTKLFDPISSDDGQATLASLGITEPSWFRPLYGEDEPIGQLLRPFPQYQDISAGVLENVGQSSYHALQAKLERRFRNGLNLLASYTFSKTLTDADSILPFFSGFSSNNFGAQNPFNLKSEKQLSYQDTPHAVVISYLYELPAGPGKKYLNHGVASKILGGWQIGAVHRYQTGSPVIFNNAFSSSPPFTNGTFKYSLIPGVPIYSPNKSNFDPSFGFSGCDRDDTTGLFTPSSTNNYFNCAAFIDPNAPGLVAQRGYTFGDLPMTLGNVRSDNYFSEDFAIVKRTQIAEGHSLILKVDIPNAFNRHIFGTLDGDIRSSTFGIPKGPRGIINASRVIQLTLRYQF